MISLDCETTGVDFNHGAKPYLVTICNEKGEQTFWEWNVDPLTREPEIPEEDLLALQGEIIGYGDDELEEYESEEVILQNGKFDVAALTTIDPDLAAAWPWDRMQDTLIAGHLLASNQPHNLTDMASLYLGIDIEPLEKRVQEATQEARRIARSRFPDWRIAKEGEKDMPSAKEKTWKYDMWLPRALARELNYPETHPWWTVTSEYANTDSETTLLLWKKMRSELERRGLWKIYRERMRVIPIAYRMEQRGISVSKANLSSLRDTYAKESERLHRVCVNVAAATGYELKMPKGAGLTNSLRDYCFKELDLPAVVWTEKGNPSLDKEALDIYQATLPTGSRPLAFVRALKSKRSLDTALSYLASYERFWLSDRAFQGKLAVAKLREAGSGIVWQDPLWFRLFPSLNPTGTDTLRWSSSNPNEQNISKKENFNLRFCFGPGPDREWWSLDAKNLELRIPAYESGEKMMVELFDRPKDPPYYGSYHLLIFDILHPDKFALHGAKSKDVYESTWYQWTKNGNFAVTYGAIERSGTADRAYHIPGAQRRIQEKLHDLTQLNDKYKAIADRLGYVETIPDKTVDPKRGYPLLCTRTENGRVLPTVPFNYHVQGTACWWTMKAMIRCQEKLDQWASEDGFNGYLVMQIHDELVFDFPKAADPFDAPDNSNLWRIEIIRKLMEQCGDDIGVPTPVSCEYHRDNWSVGEAV